MFRKTLLIAALALSATAGLARAEGEGGAGNVAETLRPIASLGENAMAAAGQPRLVVIAGMDRPVVVYDGPSTQNYAAPSTTLRVVPTFEGSYRTERN
jgi:hypothetical protein